MTEIIQKLISSYAVTPDCIGRTNNDSVTLVSRDLFICCMSYVVNGIVS